jgi:hypothetical protein
MTDPHRWGTLALAVVLAGACTEVAPPTLPDDPEPVPFTLRVRNGSEYVVRPTEVLILIVDLEREPGFDAPVTFSTETPAGIVLLFRPETISNRPSTDIVVVADTSTAPATYPIELVGRTGEGQAAAVTLTLTVVE